MPELKQIAELLTRGNSFYLLSHMLPDGDSIGSLLALGEALKRLGKKVRMVIPGEVPRRYRFLKGSEEIAGELSFDGRSTVVVLDCSDLGRLGELGPQVEKAPVLINIDHHVSNRYFGTVNLVDSSAGAAGEIVFRLLAEMGLEPTPSMATALYVALATDTGSFKYDNTTSNTHRIAADLVERGCRPGLISRRLFDLRTLPSFILLKEVLPTLELYSRRRIAILTVSRDLLERCGAVEEDMGGLVNYSVNIEGVEIGVLFYTGEREEIKVGIRSRRLDISGLAEKFGGGGHAKAAGCRIPGAYPPAKAAVLKEAHALLREATGPEEEGF